jgi:arylsulfatase A-like enzyme
MRADHMGCSGNHRVRTPNIDRLAAEGLRFNRSYCANPICMPARASMFTGLLPRDHGVRINGQALSRGLPTLPAILKNAGYRTQSMGKLHLTPWMPKPPRPKPDEFPEDLEAWMSGSITRFPDNYFGFESSDLVVGHTSYAHGDYARWLSDRGGSLELLKPDSHAYESHPLPYTMQISSELHYNRYIADSAMEAIRRHTQDDRPFFIWCSFPDPHEPVASPEPYASMYSPDEVDLPKGSVEEAERLPEFYRDIYAGKIKPNNCDSTPKPDETWRRIIAGTYGMVTHIDTEVGRVLEALDESGLRDNTLVLFLSDHGDMMGDHGLLWKGVYTFDGCIRIPTIVRDPRAESNVSRGQVSEELISQVDFLPSILDYCGVEHPAEQWRERTTPFERGAVYPIETYPGRSWLGLLRGRREEARAAVVIENDSPSTGLSPRCVVTDRYRLTYYPRIGTGELFDLQADPDELYNLWHEPNLRSTKSELLEKLMSEYAAWTPFFPVPPWNS